MMIKNIGYFCLVMGLLTSPLFSMNARAEEESREAEMAETCEKACERWLNHCATLPVGPQRTACINSNPNCVQHCTNNTCMGATCNTSWNISGVENPNAASRCRNTLVFGGFMTCTGQCWNTGPCQFCECRNTNELDPTTACGCFQKIVRNEERVE